MGETEYNERMASDLVNHSGIPMFAHDVTGTVLLFNQAAEGWTGWSRDEAEIMGFHGLLVPDSRQVYFEWCRRVAQEEVGRVVVPMQVLSPQGQVRSMDVELFRPAVAPPGCVYALGWPAGMGRREVDLGAELQREKDISARLSGVAEVASGVLHNVGNVINSVNVSSTLIEDELRQSPVENLSKLAGILRDNAERLGDFMAEDPRGRGITSYLEVVVEHMRQQQERLRAEVAGLRRGVEHIKEVIAMQQSYSSLAGTREILSLPELVEDALRMNEAAFERHGVSVVREFSPTAKVVVDRHRVLQILINLFRNAKYALDEGGATVKELRVRTAVGEQGQMQVSVIDNGIGVAPELIERIFERGYTTRKEGHGFGLHSGRRAAEELGGTLVCRSAGRGKGAEFVLTLPASPAAEHGQ
ncbi:MAG: PAS domain-containing sensor histidine kinase [Verrucomicrobiales bacterium]|nr:PAS domain-containing sensor histidine kinase [Verrucomicrobiales bacterium]